MKRLNGWFFLRALALSFVVFSGELQSKEVPLAISNRKDSIPKNQFENQEDSYLEGYIQALLNSHYYEFDILVYVKGRDVYLHNLPKNDLLKKSIMNFVKELPEVNTVKEVSKFPDEKLAKREKREVIYQVKGTWFPQTTVLYPPMVANPRETLYSSIYRFSDKSMGHRSVGVSMGDNFPLFRWRNVFPWKGDLQLDVQAGIWSVFKMWIHYRDEVSELMNTDYLVGVPLTYAFDKWAFRLRAYHVSSHLGDEYLVHNNGIKRVNPSMEAVDFFISYQLSDGIRLYVGPGWVFHSDDSYPLKPPLYIEYGGEARLFGYKNFYHKLHGTPFVALYFRNWQVNKWKLDGTYMLGYEWSKLQGVGRKMRLFINYHHGYSEGQFFKDKISYTGAGVSWGF